MEKGELCAEKQSETTLARPRPSKHTLATVQDFRGKEREGSAYGVAPSVHQYSQGTGVLTFRSHSRERRGIGFQPSGEGKASPSTSSCLDSGTG